MVEQLRVHLGTFYLVEIKNFLLKVVLIKLKSSWNNTIGLTNNIKNAMKLINNSKNKLNSKKTSLLEPTPNTILVRFVPLKKNLVRLHFMLAFLYFFFFFFLNRYFSILYLNFDLFFEWILNFHTQKKKKKKEKTWVRSGTEFNG